MYYVYILYSAEIDVYYKGFSTDVAQRLNHHLNGLHKFTTSVSGLYSAIPNKKRSFSRGETYKKTE